MADSHRRRVKSDDDSEKSFSESDVEVEDSNEPETTVTDTPEKDVPEKVVEVSEYESVEEEDETEEIPNESVEELKPKDAESLSEIVDEEGGEEAIAETEDVEGDFLSGDGDPNDGTEEDEEYVEEERQQGDGEECSPNAANEKELDFDEDRRNPQYIPKKGIFYEHDDRNNEDVKEKEEEPVRDRKKKLWLDEGKWGHDRFREEEQYPKSRNELIEAYGYDIRNEDGPPRARRRRRYGRGPTKYDRNWEDVTAYGREKFKTPDNRGTPRGRRGGRFRGAPRFRGGHFNANNGRNENESSFTPEVPTENEREDAEHTDNSPVINNNEFPALPSKESEPVVDNASPEQTYFNKNSPSATEAKSVRTLTFENSNYGSRNSVERDIPPRRGKTPPFSGQNSRGNRRPNPRGNRGSSRGDYNKRGRGNMRHISPRFLENKANSLSNDMEQLSLEAASEVCNDMNSEVHHSDNNGVLPTNSNENDLPNVALKGGGDSSGRPKRYSSLRQRSLPESNTYQTPPPSVPPPHPTYYETGYQTTIYAPPETCVPTPSTQSQTVTSTPILNPTAYQTFTPPSYTDSYGLRMTTPPRLFPQVSVPAPQPLLAPQPIIAPTPNIMSFAPPPPHAGYQQYAYQQFATPQPPPPPV